MKQTEIYNELKELAKNLGITIRRVNGSISGGLCTVKDKMYILVNKTDPPEVVINVIATGIASLGIENLYIKPVIREIIEKEVLSRNRLIPSEKIK